jgi:hypothetical protein
MIEGRNLLFEEEAKDFLKIYGIPVTTPTGKLKYPSSLFPKASFK